MVKKYAFLFLILVSSLLSSSQSVDISKYFNNLAFSVETSLPTFGISNGINTIVADNFPDWLCKELLNSTQISFKKVKSEKDDLGFTHTRYVEIVNGSEVYHSSLIVHEFNGYVESFNGNFYRVTPVLEGVELLNESDALYAALKQVGAKIYKWQDAFFENSLKNAQDNLEATYYPKGELIYSGKFEKEYGGEFILCYKFPIASLEPFVDEMILVNAVDGKIYWRENMIVDADSNGKANTYHRGYKKIVADYITTNSFRLHASKYKLKTYKGAIGTDFADTDNDWNNTAEKTAGDVHWGAQNVYSFLNSTFGFNSYDNKGGDLVSIVDLAGSGNAFWNLSSNNATFLAAKSGTTEPCVSLDVVGHEYGHGVADEVAGLMYSGEGCMLHESFADINGQNVEWYADSTKANWKLGEEVWPTSGGIRNLRDPYIFSHPKTYQGKFWTSGGCHNPGEVQNYFYYLMCVGDTGTNDFLYKFSLKGLGRTKANKIYYRSMQYYVTPSHQFKDMVKTTLKAAKDLYGNCSNEYNTVYQAWKIVNLEDTSLKGVDYSHGIVSGTKFCGTLPTTVSFGCLGDLTRKVTWSFGVNDTSNLLALTHVYNSTGPKKVKLTTRVCNKSFFDSVIVNVNLVPVADFVITGVPFCQFGLDSVRFTNKSINKDKTLKLDYEWTVDPILLKSKNTNFALSKNNDPRDYIVSLFAHYSTGCSDLFKDTFTLYSNPAPSFTVKSVCEGKPVKIINTTDTVGQNLNFLWKTGSQSSTLFNPTNLTLSKGIQNIELNAKSILSGCESKINNSVEIWENPIPVFDYSNNCKGGQLQLINKTKVTRPLLWFEWDLGIFKPQNKDTFLYKIPVDSNSLWIGLRMADNRSCIGEIFKKISIEKVLPDFVADTVCFGSSTNFKNKTVYTGDLPVYEWNFGDGSVVSSNTNETHKYSSDGLYTVNLKAKNSICEGIKTKMVLVKDKPNASFKVNDICSGDTAKFQNKSISKSFVPNWFWAFGDSKTDTSQNPNHRYVVNQTQTNIVSLIAKNGKGCSDTFASAINISELPKPIFTYFNHGNNYFKFKSTGVNYSVVEWDFGDGTFSTDPEPLHQFSTSGIYLVKLKVKNSGNCFATTTLQKANHSGVVSFEFKDFNLYPNPSIGKVVFSGLTQKSSVEIVNMLGQILLKLNIDSSSQVVDLSSFAKGIYTVKVSIGKESVVKKLVLE